MLRGQYIYIYKDCCGIKYPRKIDMQLIKEKHSNQTICSVSEVILEKLDTLSVI